MGEDVHFIRGRCVTDGGGGCATGLRGHPKRVLQLLDVLER